MIIYLAASFALVTILQASVLILILRRLDGQHRWNSIQQRWNDTHLREHLMGHCADYHQTLARHIRTGKPDRAWFVKQRDSLRQIDRDLGTDYASDLRLPGEAR